MELSGCTHPTQCFPAIDIERVLPQILLRTSKPVASLKNFFEKNSNMLQTSLTIQLIHMWEPQKISCEK